MAKAKLKPSERLILLIKCYSSDEINNNEMDCARSTYGLRRGAYMLLLENLD
jgi:hypothetical protein